MNEHAAVARFRSRINAELRNLKGDSSLAERVMALAEEKRLRRLRRKSALRKAFALGAACALLLLPLIFLSGREPPDDHTSALMAAGRDSALLIKTSMYCPVCNRVTQWVEDCGGDAEDVHPETDENVLYAHSCIVCINCANRYVLDKRHEHAVLRNGAEYLICPYGQAERSADDEIVKAALSQAEDAKGRRYPVYREAYCENCAAFTRWREICGEDVSAYFRYPDRSDPSGLCEVTVVYAKTCLVCVNCGAQADAPDSHLHLISRRAEKTAGKNAAPQSRADFTCPLRK